MSDEILTLKEVAALLELAAKLVGSTSQTSEIPPFKSCGQWRSRRNELDQWIDAHPRGGNGAGHGE